MRYMLLICGWLVVTNANAQTSLASKHYNIGQLTLEFVDENRDNRPVITELWYPTSDSLKESDRRFSPFKREFSVANATPTRGDFPLIMISHGSGGNRFSLEWLAQGLVLEGYVVGAVDHWGGTYENKLPAEYIKPWERPLDMSFALSGILTDPRFKSSIDTSAIGAIGFSYGGHTVLALAGAVIDYTALLDYYQTPQGSADLEAVQEFFGISELIQDESFKGSATELPSLKDNRIKAYFAISPAIAQGFTSKEQFQELTDPVFIVGCQADKVTPVSRYARHYHDLIDDSQYYEFQGEVGHYVMLAQANEAVKQEAPIPFTDHPSVDRSTVHKEVKELAINFLSDSFGLNAE